MDIRIILRKSLDWHAQKRLNGFYSSPRNTKNKKARRSKKFDKYIYRGRSAVERFNSWIEANKKISVRYEYLEISYVGANTISLCYDDLEGLG